MNIGAISFVIGSILFLPSISKFTEVAILFIIGSLLYMCCDIVGMFID